MCWISSFFFFFLFKLLKSLLTSPLILITPFPVESCHNEPWVLIAVSLKSGLGTEVLLVPHCSLVLGPLQTSQYKESSSSQDKIASTFFSTVHLLFTPLGSTTSSTLFLDLRLFPPDLCNLTFYFGGYPHSVNIYVLCDEGHGCFCTKQT